MTRESLFIPESFVGHSGQELPYKIECDALTPQDWSCLALMAKDILCEDFSNVWGIPRGGYPFANALRQYAVPNASSWLIVDDVWTTGKSVFEFRKQYNQVQLTSCLVVIVFNRSGQRLPSWARSIFTVTV